MTPVLRRGKQHPVSGGEEHPALNVGQSLFAAIHLKPQKTRHESQTQSLDPVQSRQHPWAGHCKVSLGQNLRHESIKNKTKSFK